MFELWNDNLNGLGAMQPTYPGDPGRGVDLGGRLIGKGGMILPAPPANCSVEYRQKYIQVFGVDPQCTPLAEAPYLVPTGLPAAPGANAGPPGPVGPIGPYPSPAPPVAQPTPVRPAVSPPVIQPQPRHRPRPVRRQTRPGGELCPSFGHYNRPIPGVDEYQVIACTPGQPLPHVNRGLRRTIKQEALARHPGGGLERTGQAGDYRGGGGGGSTSMSASSSIATGLGNAGQVCLSPVVLIGAVAVLFFMMKR